MLRTDFASAECWRRFAIGLRCKQIALFILLFVPVVAAILWNTESNSIWTVLLIVVGVAAIMDHAGRVLVWISGIGDRWLVSMSVITQSAGLVSCVSFGFFVPDFGWPIGLVAALSLQAVSAFTFTNYLADVCDGLGDHTTHEKTTRLRVDILGGVISLSGLGVMTLIVGLLLAVITIFTAGIGLIVGIPVAILTLVATGIPLVYFVLSMFRRYANVLSSLHRLSPTTIGPQERDK